MQENEGRIGVEARQGIPGRQRKTELFRNRASKRFRQLQIAIDGVRAPIDFRDSMIKQPRTFAAIADSPKLSRPAAATDQSAPEQTLEIESNVWTQHFCFSQPGQQTAWRAQAAKLAARKNVNMIDIRIATQECCPFRIDHPGNLGRRVGLADRRHGWQCVNHVTERTRFDDQDGFDFRFQNVAMLAANKGSGSLQTAVFHKL